MLQSKRSNISFYFELFARRITEFTGSTPAFIIAFTIILLWGITGPAFHYSDTWQLVINTGTTIITFLMVFLIQRSQNNDSRAVHLKLNELIAANVKASNRLIDIEDMSEEELAIMHKFYQVLAEKAKKEIDIRKSHSIEEANLKHLEKISQYNEERKSKKAKT